MVVSCSGAPTHYHQIAVNALAWGEKHWLVAPAKDAERSDVSAAEGLSERLAQARANPRALEFVQNAGDLVLLPQDYSHSTYNLRPSVGVAAQLNFDIINFADHMRFIVGDFDEDEWRSVIENPTENDTWVLNAETGDIQHWTAPAAVEE